MKFMCIGAHLRARSGHARLSDVLLEEPIGVRLASAECEGGCLYAGNTGDLCATCKDSHYRDNRGTCHECTSGSSDYAVLPVLMFAAVVVLMWFYL